MQLARVEGGAGRILMKRGLAPSQLFRDALLDVVRSIALSVLPRKCEITFVHFLYSRAGRAAYRKTMRVRPKKYLHFCTNGGQFPGWR